MGILRKNCVRAVCLQLILCFVFMLFACSAKAPEHPITVHLTIRCEDLENDAQAPKGVRTLLDTDCIIEEGTNVFDLVVARAKAAKLAKKVITHEKEVLGCDGYNVLQNNGEAAGQTVFHFHMHLIPRKAGDQAVPEWEHLSLSDDEMKEICDKMKM